MTVCTAYGIDGKAPSAILIGADCCPVSPCAIDDAGFICDFISQALPSGPAWDNAKLAQYDFVRDACANGMACAPPPCSNLVAYVSYSAARTLLHTRMALWPSVREANPLTAWTTRQNYIDMWGWKNCFLDPNRSSSLGLLTPYEIAAPISCEVVSPAQGVPTAARPPAAPARTLSPPVVPQPLQDAITSALVIALARRALGPVPTVDVINFVIAPLGAQLVVDPPRDVYSEIDQRLAGVCLPPASTQQGIGSADPIYAGYEQFCSCGTCTGGATSEPYEAQGGSPISGCCVYSIPLNIKICPISDTILAAAQIGCPTLTPQPDSCDPSSQTVQSYVSNCDPSLPWRVYPGVLAAECIARSMLPSTLNYTMYRTCDAIPAPLC